LSGALDHVDSWSIHWTHGCDVSCETIVTSNILIWWICWSIPCKCLSDLGFENTPT